jgi:hypothetical protein
MRVEIRTKSEYQTKRVSKIFKKLSKLAPNTMQGKEYVAIIEYDCVSIFWANVEAKCFCVCGSVHMQDIKGCRKIGFIDIWDKHPKKSVKKLIRDYWTLESKKAHKNLKYI